MRTLIIAFAALFIAQGATANDPKKQASKERRMKMQKRVELEAGQPDMSNKAFRALPAEKRQSVLNNYKEAYLAFGKNDCKTTMAKTNAIKALLPRGYRDTLLFQSRCQQQLLD